MRLQQKITYASSFIDGATEYGNFCLKEEVALANFMLSEVVEEELVGDSCLGAKFTLYLQPFANE